VVTQLTCFGITILAGCTSEAQRSALFGKQKSHGSKSSNQACTNPKVTENRQVQKMRAAKARGPSSSILL
jgi:hypothetical protein